MEEFLNNIARLSDEKYQERVWIRVEGPECSDIDDTVCDFFDDGDPILEKYNEYGISENQLILLLSLHNKLRWFADTFKIYSPEKSNDKLLQLSQWEEIREISKNVLTAFNYKKSGQ